jgi:23S rRNA G2445 N2-methylase RlmL
MRCCSTCTAASRSACWYNWRTGPYRSENDLYELASSVAWEVWFTTRHSFKVEVTAQHSPLKSLNFAALRVKDAVADRFRAKSGVRPDVNTQWPDVRIHLHLTTDEAMIYIDTSGEPLFKRGWREDKGDAPLKETLAAAMIAASGWDPHGEAPVPLYDPCCGSGTVVIEAAQMACCIAPGLRRRFAFRKAPALPGRMSGMLLKHEATDAIQEKSPASIFGSDVSHRMVDFSERNAERAGVAQCCATAGRRRVAAHAAVRDTGRHAAEPALWRAHCRRRYRGAERLAARIAARPRATARRGVKPRIPTMVASSSVSWRRTGRSTTPAGPPGCSRPTSSCPARCV